MCTCMHAHVHVRYLLGVSDVELHLEDVTTYLLTYYLLTYLLTYLLGVSDVELHLGDGGDNGDDSGGDRDL